MAPLIPNKTAVSGGNAPFDFNTSSIVDDNTNQAHTEHSTVSIQPTETRSTTDTKSSSHSPKADKMLEHFEIFGEDDFAVAFFFWLSIILAAALCALFLVSLSWITATICVLAGFVLVRRFT